MHLRSSLPRRHRLALALALILAGAAADGGGIESTQARERSSAPRTESRASPDGLPLPVSNCNDSGEGSLRAAMAAPALMP